jgi:Family of unknown function (DUF6677)
MSATELKPTPGPPRKMDPLAGVLSYLIPGLGQIIQGRFSKGIVFFVSLYALFFYGMALGKFRNVYLPDTAGELRRLKDSKKEIPESDITDAEKRNSFAKVINDLYNRPHYAGQFFIGIAAWPSVLQYHNFDPAKQQGPVFGEFMRAPHPDELNRLQREESKTWDLGWVYTVIAGVLNILVIYDAIAGPAFREATVKASAAPKKETATA